MTHPKTIIFVCEHGAAKSIIAAAYFNKLARDRNLGLTATARGTHPDAVLSPKAVSGLQEDGLTPTESVPMKLNAEDLISAQQVVSFCILPVEYHQKARVEYWEGIPPVSENFETARDAIVERLKELLNHL
jgi:arsenate reductase (thioredoxin)